MRFRIDGAWLKSDRTVAEGRLMNAVVTGRLRRGGNPPLVIQDDTLQQAALRIVHIGEHDVVAVDMLGVFNRQDAQATAIWTAGIASSLHIYF